MCLILCPPNNCHCHSFVLTIFCLSIQNYLKQFPGTFTIAKRAAPLPTTSSTPGPLYLQKNTTNTNEKVVLLPAAPTSYETTTSSACRPHPSLVKVPASAPRSFSGRPKPVSVIDETTCYPSSSASSSALCSDNHKLTNLKSANDGYKTISVVDNADDHCDVPMEEEEEAEDERKRNIREAQEQIDNNDYSDDDDHDGLSTTNHHNGDIHSTTTTSSMNVQEDDDYEMGGLFSTNCSKPRRSAVGSLTLESSRSSPVLQLLDKDAEDENYTMDDHQEQHQVVVSSRTSDEKIGRTGLSNLGNTCFMNSTIQCLAHTDMLRQYFTSGQYQDDLNVDNPLGTRGELATEFAKLLSEMWTYNASSNGSTSTSSYLSSSYRYSSDYSSYSNGYGSNVVYPRNFKYALGKHAEQFIGYDQHDSQELATYLLDALHEDTNRVIKKPYAEKPEQKSHESDCDAAAKAWAMHLQRENSFVMRTFLGQVKSKVTCPVQGCGRVSTTYDPFMYLSVPVRASVSLCVP